MPHPMFDLAEAPRRAGRPRSSESEAERNKHLLCLFRWRFLGLRYATIAFEMKVSRPTVTRWCRLAETYAEAASDEALAAAVGSMGRRRLSRGA